MENIIIIVSTFNKKKNIKSLFNKLTATKIRFDLLFNDSFFKKNFRQMQF